MSASGETPRRSSKRRRNVITAGQAVEGPRVIVVGAGLSGLSCALHLVKTLGASVTVLEARERVGGRCWSHTMKLSHGGEALDGGAENGLADPLRAAVDLGAGWIHGIRGNPLSRLCTSYRLEMAFTGSGQVIPMYDACTGHMAPPQVDEKVERVFNEGLTAASAVGEVDLLAEEMVARHAPRLVASAQATSGAQQTARPVKQRFPGAGMFLPLMEVYLGQVASWTKLPQEDVQEVAVVLESMLFAAECIGTESLMQQTALGDYLSVHFDMCIPYATPLERRLFWWHRSNLEYANATDLGALSAAYWNFDDEHSFSGAHALLRQGYGALAAELARDAEKRGVEIKLAHEVSLIDSARGFVSGKRREESGAKPVAFKETADFIVVTLPLGVLKDARVRFTPALPAAKTRAIEQLGFGNLNKVALAFPYCFWDQHFPVLANVSASPGEFFLAVNMKPVAQANVLVLLASGAFCNALESMSDAEAVQRAMASLQRMYPRVAVPPPTDFIVTRWRSDPLARGSYSFIKRGATPDRIADLAAPLPGGKVFFAGEATSSKHIATAHGAYLSGLRAGKDITEAFTGKPSSSSSVPATPESATSAPL
ncbi:Lysine-specific histone demethylase 1A [Hondaea fermentalgiana]|uniref:Lysine-specific histone demethylase 1A n=1 Tax=Hondaea fermentalgiana TaxID=2315210 RepID=A0A2R5G9S8_9STRA|nr:Lysine-specific histone demethylase 1A [Hondaea fermentalgiana]|eukprot:GBG27315.1 Lysine-specific histone demethylase 1A [Hondaea fermentalgiana]